LLPPESSDRWRRHSRSGRASQVPRVSPPQTADSVEHFVRREDRRAYVVVPAMPLLEPRESCRVDRSRRGARGHAKESVLTSRWTAGTAAAMIARSPGPATLAAR